MERQLGRLWRFIETSDDVDGADLSARIREHRDRQQRLEESAADASAVLDQRKSALGDVNTIAMYAVRMTDFLDESELAEARTFVKSFVKEIVVTPGFARVRYTIPISQSTRKAQVLMGGRFGCDRVKVRRTDSWGATSALMIGSNSLRWAKAYRFATFSVGGPTGLRVSSRPCCTHGSGNRHRMRILRDAPILIFPLTGRDSLLP